MPRQFEFSTPVDGPRDVAWAVLTGFDAYSEWSHLVPFASGTLEPGASVTLHVRGPGRYARPFHPKVVSVDTSRELVFEASVGHRSLIHMVHYFTIAGTDTTQLYLRQRWVTTGLLVPILWPLLRRAMTRFREFGTNFNGRVSAVRSGAV